MKGLKFKKNNATKPLQKKSFFLTNKNNKELAISILNCDFLNLKNEIDKIIKANINCLHYDVIDGTFASWISFGPNILKQIRKYFNGKIEVHLMVNDSVRQYQYFAPYCDHIIFHLESSYLYEVKRLIEDIHLKNKTVGIAISPKTNVEQIYEYLPYCEEILIMTVVPGCSGQKFINKMLTKIIKLKKYLIKYHLNKKITIGVDGGINFDTSKKSYLAGASKFVVGSFFFNENNINFKKIFLNKLEHKI